MNIGDQIEVVRNWGPLIPRIEYYFLLSDQRLDRVLLVLFTKQKIDYASHLIEVNRSEFEQGLLEGVITRSESQRSLPIWLEELEEKNLYFLDQIRKNPKKSNQQRIQERFLAIAEAVDNRDHILGADDPNLCLNMHARNQTPPQHPTRFKLWFFSYTLFSDNIWVLLPKFHNIGKWSRANFGIQARFGRSDVDGNKVRYNATEDIREAIYTGYSKYMDDSRTIYQAYSKFMRNDLGCVLVKVGEDKVFIHPKSRPFPSFNQFKYHAEKEYGERERKMATRGELETKANSAPIGRYSSAVSNVFEKVEFDGFYIKEKPTALDGKTPIPGFCTVRAVCLTSGLTLGIGFSRASENLEAYLMCLFCMAISKTKFLELFGMSGELYDWHCEGLSPSLITDRGPGSVLDAYEHIEWLGSIELAPSQSGQSKATVESAHPRSKVLLKKTAYLQSNLNYIQMAKKEITVTCMENHTSDASGRMTDDMKREGVRPSPYNIFKFLDQRARSSARTIGFQAAVRRFLPRRPAKLKPDGVWLLGRKYASPELVETGVFDRVVKFGTRDCEVYVLNMCVRHVWFELQGVLYELGAIFSLRTDEGERDLTIFELEALEKTSQLNLSRHKASKPAEVAYFEQLFKGDTGRELNSGTSKPGRLKNTKLAKSLLNEQKNGIS